MSSDISYEGINLIMPTLEGLKFHFKDGALVLECKQYTGNITLVKPKLESSRCGVIPMQEVEVDVCLAANKIAVDASMSAVDNEESSIPTPCNPELESKVSSPLIRGKRSAKKSAKSSNKKRNTLPKEKPSDIINKQVASTQNFTDVFEMDLIDKENTTPIKKMWAENVTTPQTVLSQSKKIDQISVASSPASSVHSLSLSTKPLEIEPPGRWGHSATRVGNQMIVYGGDADEESTLGDLYTYDMVSKLWSQPMNCHSIPRCWHSAVYVKTKNLLVVFGGERMVAKGSSEALADLMVLDTEVFLWYPPAVTGNVPGERSGQTCVEINGNILLFGGSRGRKWFNKVEVLDTESWHWETAVINGLAPDSRTYHSATPMGSRMVVFGGNNSKRSFNDVVVLETDKNKGPWSWFHPCVVGTPPSPRTGHSATALNAHLILVYGGWDPQAESGKIQVFSDAFILDTDAWEWTQVSYTMNTKDAPTLRVGHSTTLFELNECRGTAEVVVFGGQDDKDIRRNSLATMTVTL